MGGELGGTPPLQEFRASEAFPKVPIVPVLPLGINEATCFLGQKDKKQGEKPIGRRFGDSRKEAKNKNKTTHTHTQKKHTPKPKYKQTNKKNDNIFLEADPIDFTRFPKKVKGIYNDGL